MLSPRIRKRGYQDRVLQRAFVCRPLADSQISFFTIGRSPNRLSITQFEGSLKAALLQKSFHLREARLNGNSLALQRLCKNSEFQRQRREMLYRPET